MKRTMYVLMALAGLTLVVFGTQGQASAQSGDNPADLAAGQAVYEMSCAGCHAVDGTGTAGLGRPLIGIADQGDRATHIASIADGKGAGMPAFGERLSEDEISQVTSYVRLAFVADAPAPALAVTGVNSTALAVVGMTMLVGGMQLVAFSRRKDS